MSIDKPYEQARRPTSEQPRPNNAVVRMLVGAVVQLTTALIVVGCVTDPEPSRPVAIVVTPGTATLDHLGHSVAFTATITDQHGDDFDGTVAWTTEDPDVFTVSSAGVATAVSNGTGRVRAELDEIRGRATVIVSQAPTEVERVAGDRQRGRPSATLRRPVVARVLDAGGSPVRNTAVLFLPAAGGGVTPRIAQVDMAGVAQATWTLGDFIGPQSLVASVADGPSTSFTATALPPNELADSVEVVSGDDQAARPGRELRWPVVVRVLDEHQDPIVGATIRFDTPSGHGTADPDSVQTMDQGEAGTTWTLGKKIGPQLLTASVPGGPRARVMATGTEGVCGRTRQIEDALIRAAGVTTCAEVTDAVLNQIRRLDLAALGITRLTVDDFLGLTDLVELNLNSNRLRQLHSGLFAELSNLEVLSLAGNPLVDLEPGVFTGLSRLTYLLLWGNLIWPLELEPGVFAGLSNLEELLLVRNGLTELPPGVFADLSNLRTLGLARNELMELPPGIFRGLSNLENLSLSGNQLNLRPGMFTGLSRLADLDLYHNQLEDLPSGVFEGLPNLAVLDLGGNRLDLRTGGFAGLSSLEYLKLYENRLTDLPSGAFVGLSNLERLDLGLASERIAGGNELTDLPSEAFTGLDRLRALWLNGNPGSPFPFELRMERTDTTDLTAPGPARVVVAVDEGAPFNIRVILSAPGATLSPTWVTIRAGARQSNLVTVTPNSGITGSVRVALGEVALPRTHCSFARHFNQGRGHWSGGIDCYKGIIVRAGDAISLFR